MECFGRVCSQRYCGTLVWPGSTSDKCDRCLAGREVCNASRSLCQGRLLCTTAGKLYYFHSGNLSDNAHIFFKRYPLPSGDTYLLPSSQLESTHSFEVEIGSEQPGHNSTSVSNHGCRSVNPPSSSISVPLYNYDNLRHKLNVNVHTLAEEQNRAHHQLQVCDACRAVIYLGTVCLHCRPDVAPTREETGFKGRDCLSEPKDIVAKSSLEGDDDLSTAVILYQNPDENLDDTDDSDMEGIELSYPEFVDNNAIEEPKPQSSEETSSSLKGNLSSEKNPQYSYQAVLDLAPTFPKWKETPRNTLRPLKLCSTMECTGTISRESLATRCLGCVRRDWKSKISKGHASHRVYKRLSSETIERSISTKQKTKKVTWADEVSHSPASQQNLKCTLNIKQLRPSSSKCGIHSVDFPTSGLNVQVGRPPSPPAEAQAPIKCLELNDPRTKSEDVSVFTEDPSALASSTPVSNDDLQLDMQVKCVIPTESSASLDMSPSVEVLNFSGRSNVSDHSREDNESDKNMPSSDSQVDPHLPKRETSPLSGFKIRIPPRPGLYVRKCGSIRCDERLSATYRWKSCVMCRARNREYQRNRQNIQAQHSRLEEDLLQSQVIGTPLSNPPLSSSPLSSSYLMDDGTSKQSLLERKAKSIPVHPSLPPSPYPRYKAFPNLLADFKVRLNDFLHAQSVFFLFNETNSRFNLARAIFIFDAEYSIVALDFDIVGDKDAVDANVLKLKGEIERMGRIQFSPKRYISILEGGGISERFLCLKQAPVLTTASGDQDVSTATYTKNMQGELEIAVVPDHSHPFLAGHRTVVRFRLLG